MMNCVTRREDVRRRQACGDLCEYKESPLQMGERKRAPLDEVARLDGGRNYLSLMEPTQSIIINHYRHQIRSNTSTLLVYIDRPADGDLMGTRQKQARGALPSLFASQNFFLPPSDPSSPPYPFYSPPSDPNPSCTGQYRFASRSPSETGKGAWCLP